MGAGGSGPAASTGTILQQQQQQQITRAGQDQVGVYRSAVSQPLYPPTPQHTHRPVSNLSPTAPDAHKHVRSLTYLAETAVPNLCPNHHTPPAPQRAYPRTLQDTLHCTYGTRTCGLASNFIGKPAVSAVPHLCPRHHVPPAPQRAPAPSKTYSATLTAHKYAGLPQSL